MLRIVCGLMLGCLLLTGCSANYNPPSQAVTPKSSNLKELLQGVANTGQIGSGAMDLETEFDKLKNSDAAKAQELEPKFRELLKADGTPSKVKQLANELVQKL
ncbi:MAG: hypothetical protein KatS3mg114_1167 [Planctomycetaceae bacterium]|nr:MAG: hypothetical protein KatS3mg114_1167 [Planctomycetaceae bacterium]